MNCAMSGWTRSPLTSSNCSAASCHHSDTCSVSSQRLIIGRSAAVIGRNSYTKSPASGLQRLNGDVAVGVDANVGGDVERLAHDRLGIERAVGERAGSGE